MRISVWSSDVCSSDLQSNLIDLVACAIVALLFQRVNIPGLATQRENETSAHIPELVCIDPATHIFDAAAPTRNVLRSCHAVSLGRPDTLLAGRAEKARLRETCVTPCRFRCARAH